MGRAVPTGAARVTRHRSCATCGWYRERTLHSGLCANEKRALPSGRMRRVNPELEGRRCVEWTLKWQEKR